MASERMLIGLDFIVRMYKTLSISRATSNLKLLVIKALQYLPALYKDFLVACQFCNIDLSEFCWF